MTKSTPIDLPNKGYLLPDAVAMWPPAWWTWLVLAMLCILLIGTLLKLLKRHKKRAYRREALGILKQQTSNQIDNSHIILCHELIRRCLISAGQEQQAALSSRELIPSLDQHMSKKHNFAQLGEAFIVAPYQANTKVSAKEIQKMLTTTCYWIRKHHA
ncbi:DUF4381 domain-containing protein [Marinomonas posidonica]|uniref:DUF4381 domain-containing protein n=1 Tax=Marinomonas posidonica (strain CECT 7376 / NCIMB 14433 / IVIA-Po-181) TaxID=491952 RepID=F6CTK1_MARPP|nr:DUF4381 domain-containing protein [Marinomonas posidonica]AEF55116.1 hypothetical protein Mar181_2078 [Marinomonas posidonica IVIA-Po-181]